MNNERRKAIDAVKADLMAAFHNLEEVRSRINDLKDEEQAYYDAMPDSFQNGAPGERANEAINALEAAHDEIDGFDFDTICNSLDEAAE